MVAGERTESRPVTLTVAGPVASIAPLTAVEALQPRVEEPTTDDFAEKVCFDATAIEAEPVSEHDPKSVSPADTIASAASEIGLSLIACKPNIY
jgi:hypothetical protein